jgi:hypothetical protein
MNKKLALFAAFVISSLASCSGPVDAQGATEEPTEGSAPDQAEIPVPELPDLGPAPELVNEVWLNTERPLRLAGLRGQVVLLDFWTFG